MKSAILGAVILAAGGATRFGRPKQLALFDGEPLVHRAVRIALAAECSPVVVVCGSESEAIRALLQDLPMEVVRNAQWSRGIGTSIRRGVEAVVARKPSPDALVLMACDQPFVTPRTIRRLAEAAAERRGIAASSYGSSLGIPTLFGAKWFSALRRLPAETGAKSLLRLHREDVAAVDFPAGAYDIDLPADLEHCAALCAYVDPAGNRA